MSGRGNVHRGSAHSGSAHPGSVRRGSVRRGCVRQGNVHRGTVRTPIFSVWGIQKNGNLLVETRALECMILIKWRFLKLLINEFYLPVLLVLWKLKVYHYIIEHIWRQNVPPKRPHFYIWIVEIKWYQFFWHESTAIKIRWRQWK